MVERFWAKVRKSDGCWEWTGAKTDGYGAIVDQAPSRALLKAHRVSWELHNGPVPPGLFICHRCDNPSCVRPDHLYAGTAGDNNRDTWTRGWGLRRRIALRHVGAMENVLGKPRDLEV